MLRSEFGALGLALVLCITQCTLAARIADCETTTTTVGEDETETATLIDQEIATTTEYSAVLDRLDKELFPREESKSSNGSTESIAASSSWWPIRQRNRRCTCEGFICGCCAGMALQRVNISQIGCMNFTYDPDEFALNLKFLMNERTMMERSVSGKNPPPLCLPIPSPFSYIPRFDFCAKFFNVFTPGRNFHACLEWQTKVNKNPVLEVQFDCFRMGADGFAIVKPDAGGGLDGISQVSPGGGGGGDTDYTGGGGGGGAGGGAIGEDYDPLDPEDDSANKKKKPARRPTKKKPKQ